MSDSFCRRFGMQHPLLQATMAGSTTPDLVAAVSGAGGLGSLGAGYLEPQAMLDQAAQVQRLTTCSYAIGLFVMPDEFVVDMPAVTRARELLDALMEREGLCVRTCLPARWAPRFSDQFAALLEARPAAAIFAFGLIDASQVSQLKQRGILLVGTATTVAEARAWEERGADAVSLQGAEAGGHRGTFLHPIDDAMIGLSVLLPLAAQAIKIPVIAAGGIMDGRGMLAATVLGAAASQLGTAFLCCPESNAAQAWKQDLLRAEAHGVTTIRSFSGRAARGLRNVYVEAMEKAIADLPAYPILNALTAPLRRAAAEAGRGDLLSEWCGQAASRVRPMPAAELVAVLMDEYEAARRSLTV